MAKVIVAFLQNQWFPAKSLPSVERAYREHGSTPETRARLNERYLFFRCLTGQRIKRAFGDLCDGIVWENASPKLASESSGAFPPDLDHMANVIRHFRPAVVVTFGRPATLGFAGACLRLAMSGEQGLAGDAQHVESPHPAARHATVLKDLERAAARVRSLAAVSAAPEQKSEVGNV